MRSRRRRGGKPTFGVAPTASPAPHQRPFETASRKVHDLTRPALNGLVMTTPTPDPTGTGQVQPGLRQSGTDDPAGPDQATTVTARNHLIRSEEQLNVRTRRVPSGRVRLEKFVVTETRTITVEVSHEETRLIHLDSTDVEGSGTAVDDDSDRWLILSEEQVVVTKVVVPRERIRLQRNTIVEDRQVTEQVRHERIDVNPTTEARQPE